MTTQPPPPTTLGLRILSTGKALPPHAVTAHMLDERLGKPSGYSFGKGGVSVRYFASAEQSQSELGAQALKDALQRAGLLPSDIDLLICACGVPEQALPTTACFVAHHAQLPAGTPAFDVNTSCLGFLTALQLAGALLAAGTYRTIAIVSVDLASRGLNWADPEASLIFGDGAAAAIVSRGAPSQGIRAFKLGTYPQGRRICELRAGGTARNAQQGIAPEDYQFQMDGKAVFKLAANIIPSFLSEVLNQAQCHPSDLDWVVPHQASHLGMAHAAKKLGLPAHKIIDIYAQHGNQVAASLPTALHELFETKPTPQCTKILLMGTGAGLTVGAMVLDL